MPLGAVDFVANEPPPPPLGGGGTVQDEEGGRLSFAKKLFFAQNQNATQRAYSWLTTRIRGLMGLNPETGEGVQEMHRTTPHQQHDSPTTSTKTTSAVSPESTVSMTHDTSKRITWSKPCTLCASPRMPCAHCAPSLCPVCVPSHGLCQVSCTLSGSLSRTCCSRRCMRSLVPSALWRFN